MIGYYVHHVGTGHLNRAREVARLAGGTVTGLSSLPAPDDWPGEWVRLERDDLGDLRGTERDATARGRLHWAPQADEGLRDRMAGISSWIARARPDVLVSDVSAEVALLARLHGVPVVSVVMPGNRGDRAHRLAYSVSSELVAAWPQQATGMVRGLTRADRERLVPLGGMSRVPVGQARTSTSSPRNALLLSGRGGGHPTAEQVSSMVADTPGWSWRVLGGSGAWSDDPASDLAAADVVVLQAGQGAVADVAASRRPAVVVPASRPFDEQLTTARVLQRDEWPCRVLPGLAAIDWSTVLDEAAAMEADSWAPWCDGGAAERFAALLGAAQRPTRRVA